VIKKALLVLFGALALFLLFEWVTFPDVASLSEENPDTTAFMRQRVEELSDEGKDATLLHQWVPYGNISPYLRRAVLVSEDNTFYEHEGVDVEGLKEALKKDWEKKKLQAGGSTITQQLAKNLYLNPSRNPIRKAKEYLIARKLEDELSKKRILEIYLNVVEFGERVYGAEAAARFYFRKSASSLTPSEAALLAGCLPNPRVMVPSEPNKRLRARQRIILSRMRRWGYMLEKDVLASKPKKEMAPAPPAETATPETTTPEDPQAVDTSVPEEPVVTTTDTTETGTVTSPTESAPAPSATETAAPETTP
jgi:monofunctional biosynthetic peptidoglycan transglycosylase